MKKLLTISLSAGIALALTGCTASTPSVNMMDAVKANEKTTCDVKANGIEKVIATAAAYNAVAKKEGVEFRRFGINNSDLIIAVQEGIKAGATEVIPKDFKGKDHKGTKKEQKIEINFAAERACKFGIGALKLKDQAEKQYRDAIPGDGYKY